MIQSTLFGDLSKPASAVLFSGMGGACLGIEGATGTSPLAAVNHWPYALRIHAMNHPETRHYPEDVFNVPPDLASRGRRLGLLWMSPDCTDHSRAKGGVPRTTGRRSLADVIFLWLSSGVQPAVLMLENVPEFKDWGPLHPDDHPDPKKRGRPIKERRGELFKEWIRKVEAFGYRVEWRLLKACDYGAPTIRQRLYLIARRDGRPIVWPEPTHGPGRPLPWRTAAECIDWSIPARSIFGRKKPLADATQRRIAVGLMKYVLNNERPYLCDISYNADVLAEVLQEGGSHGLDGRRSGVDSARCDSGERRRDGVEVEEPERRAEKGTAPPRKTVEAWLSDGSVLSEQEAIPSRRASACVDGAARADPVWVGHKPSRRKPDQQRTEQLRGCDALGESSPFLPATREEAVADMPSAAVGGSRVRDSQAARDGALLRENWRQFGCRWEDGVERHQRYVAAFLVSYYGQSIGSDLRDPCPTVTTKDRFGLVTVEVEGHPYVVTDIRMRMLAPRELARAMGFPDSYQMDGTIQDQVAAVGNAVCPPVARALVAANVGPAASAVWQ